MNNSGHELETIELPTNDDVNHENVVVRNGRQRSNSPGKAANSNSSEDLKMNL